MELLVLIICAVVIWNLTLTRKIYRRIFSLQNNSSPKPETPEFTNQNQPAEDEFGLFFSTVESIRKKTRSVSRPMRNSRPRPPKRPQPNEPSIAVPVVSGSQHSTSSIKNEPSSKAQKSVPKRKLETWIGTQLLSKVGLALFVIGIGMLLKHTLGFIGKPEIANSILGGLVASTTLFFGHRLRRRTPTFAAILTAGAFVIYHLTLMVGHLYYEVYSDALAIVLYSANALAASVVAVKRNRPELLIIAQIGVWVSPFFTTGFFNNSATLLLYVFAYASGALVVAYLKKWKFSMLTAWIGTVIHLALVIVGHSQFGIADRLLIMCIHLAFTLPLFTAEIRQLWNLEARSIYALGAQLFFMLIGTVVFDGSLPAIWKGAYVGGMAVVSWTLILLHHHRKISVPEFWLLPVAVLASILAPVLHFELASLALILSFEALALVFIGHRHQNRALKGYALLILTIAGVATTFQCILFWNDRTIHDLFLLHRASLSVLSFIISLTGMATLLSKDALIRLPFIGLANASGIQSILMRIAKWFIYIYLSIELLSWSMWNLPNTEAVIITNFTFHISCFLLLTHLTHRINRWKFLQATGGVLLLLYGLVLADPSQQLYIEALQGELPIGWTLAHIPALLVCMYLATRSWSFISKQPKMEADHILNLIIVTIGWLVVLSREFDLVALQLRMPVGTHISEIIRENRLWGYAPLWSLLGFIYVWIGFRKSRLIDRWAGLGIFCLLIVKLFFMDIFELPKGARIVAFIVLGLLLIIASFFYHKLKEMLTSKDP